MREVHKISLIALGYSFILGVVSFIFFKDYAIWAVLGSLTALFNHSQIIRATKGKYTTRKLMIHLTTRYLMYAIIIAFAWFETKELGQDVMQKAFIFLLLGFVSIKAGVFVYATPLIKKTDEIKKEEVDDDTSS